MDILTSLTAVSQALNIAKEIKEIDRSIDDAEFKLKIAELMSALADAKVSLSDAHREIGQLREEIIKLKEGDICPVCKTGRLKIISVQPHEFFVGTEFHEVSCSSDDCDYRTERQFDSNRGIYTSKKE